MKYRYTLHEEIGRGGMGIVYRATDRLTGNVVALKQVTVPKQDLRFASFSTNQSIRSHEFALAQEFQTLASLHHPHIISVLDYGFDEDSLPYFTMNYLDKAQTLLESGRKVTKVKAVQLVQHLLEALAYLHRRGILHRDLKPGNVVVVNGQAQILDFGLAMVKEKATMQTGTLAYIAPEVLDGEPATGAADLYAVGVMMYELFAGKHPFDNTRRAQFIRQILNTPPDLSQLNCSEALGGVIGKLLAKRPEERYQQARDVIVALSEAMNLPLTSENVAIRESYLQAATFVGREVELNQLMLAMVDAQAGQGSSWLIGGESGVGKSRLFEELRIRALVNGAFVLHGQGVEGESRMPYQLWRGAVRRLVLGTELDDLAVGVLQPLVPDIGFLLGREVVPAPVLSEKAAQQRLLNAIVALFQQAKQWILLILEDLHWASEDLVVLSMLNRMVVDLPILIIGNYRHDERPHLPAELPDMQTMILPRFSAEEIRKLSTAILGKVGRQQAVLDLLQQETEGNVFFLVEVVRALAEKTGRLHAIGEADLPEKLFPKGIQTIVQRRLQQVPAETKHLLHLVAIAGRQLDLLVVEQLIILLGRDIDLDEWLRICSDVAVLEIHAEEWRFVHDKLREGLLLGIDPSQRPLLHTQVAQAITQVYPDDPNQAAILMRHWYEAKQPEKEQRYARIAGEYAAQQFANEEALYFLSRAFELTPQIDIREQYEVLLSREKVNSQIGDRIAQRQDIDLLTTLLPHLGEREQAEIAVRQVEYAEKVSDYSKALVHIQTVITLAQQLDDRCLEAEGYRLWGIILWRQGVYDQAIQQLKTSIELAETVDDQQTVVDSLYSLGQVAIRKEHLDEAYDYYEQALLIYQQLEDIVGESKSFNGLGVIRSKQGNLTEARQYFEQSLALFQKMGNKSAEGVLLNNLGTLAMEQWDWAQAKIYYERAYPILVQVDDQLTQTICLSNLGRIAVGQTQFVLAQEYYQEALTIVQKIGNRTMEGTVWHGMGRMALKMGNWGRAEDCFSQALVIREALGQHKNVVEDKAGLASIALGKNEVAVAYEYIDSALDYFANHSMLHDRRYPYWAFFVCGQVLQRVGEVEQAQKIIEAAYKQLVEQVENLPTSEAQEQFWQGEDYAGIRQLWHELFS